MHAIMRHNLWLSLTRNGIGPDGSRACCKLYFYKLVLDHFGQMRHGGLYLERRWNHFVLRRCTLKMDSARNYAIDFTAMTQTAHHGIKNKRALRIQANQNTVESTSIAGTTFLCMARFGSMICPRTRSFLLTRASRSFAN